METKNFNKSGEIEKQANMSFENELEEYGINVEEVLGDLNPILKLTTAKNKMKQNIIDRIDSEFERFTSFSEKLLEKQSLVIPLKMAEQIYQQKNSRQIFQKLTKLLNNQTKTVQVNGIGLVVGENEGETARQKVIRQLKEKQILMGAQGLNGLFNEHAKLKSEDFPIIYDGQLFFLEGVQDFWKLMKNPKILDSKKKTLDGQSFKVFVGGFDKDEKKRICCFLENEFGLVRLTKQRVIQDVLFGVKYAHLMESFIEKESEEIEDEQEVKMENDENEEENSEKMKRKMIEELKESNIFFNLIFRKIRQT